MAIQNHPLFFHHDEALEVFRDIKQVLPIVKQYIAVIPSYTGAFQSFVFASKKYDQLVIDQFDKQTKYLNFGILKSCFDLPELFSEFQAE